MTLNEIIVFEWLKSLPAWAGVLPGVLIAVYGVLIPGQALPAAMAVGLCLFASLMVRALPGAVAETIAVELSPEGARRRAAARAREKAEAEYQTNHRHIDDGSFGGTTLERDGVHWRDSSGNRYTENFDGSFSRDD